MEMVDTHLAMKQAEEAVRAINPKSKVVRIWMGDSWPKNDTSRTMFDFGDNTPTSIPMIPNPDADSLIEFSDGYMIVARTHEQSTGNPAPRFGKARRDAGSKTRRTRKAKG